MSWLSLNKPVDHEPRIAGTTRTGIWARVGATTLTVTHATPWAQMLASAMPGFPEDAAPKTCDEAPPKNAGPANAVAYTRWSISVMALTAGDTVPTSSALSP